jgi:hypothetical protein
MSDDKHKPIKPANAKRFPGKKVGDFVYSGDSDSGFAASVVVAVDAEGHLLVSSADFDLSYPPSYACDFHCATLQEAMLVEIERDTDYANVLLAYAHRVRETIAAGGDLTPLMEGKHGN